MDKKIQNYLAFGQKELKGKEIFSDVILILIPAIVYGVFRFSKLNISLVSILLIIAVITLGVWALIKKSDYAINLYRGVAALCNSVHWLMLSALCTIISGANAVITISSFIVIVFVVCIAICKNIDRLIEQDAYNTEYKQTAKGSRYTGFLFAFILCPLIFSNISQHAVYVIIAFCALIVGTLFLLGVNYLKKAKIYHKAHLG